MKMEKSNPNQTSNYNNDCGESNNLRVTANDDEESNDNVNVFPLRMINPESPGDNCSSPRPEDRQNCHDFLNIIHTDNTNEQFLIPNDFTTVADLLLSFKKDPNYHTLECWTTGDRIASDTRLVDLYSTYEYRIKVGRMETCSIQDASGVLSSLMK
jgi:hypothetical protein